MDNYVKFLITLVCISSAQTNFSMLRRQQQAAIQPPKLLNLITSQALTAIQHCSISTQNNLQPEKLQTETGSDSFEFKNKRYSFDSHQLKNILRNTLKQTNPFFDTYSNIGCALYCENLARKLADKPQTIEEIINTVESYDHYLMRNTHKSEHTYYHLKLNIYETIFEADDNIARETAKKITVEKYKKRNQ